MEFHILRQQKLQRFLVMLVLHSLLMLEVSSSYPSTRRVYYLHTTSATWSSARDTCVKYDGHLLTYDDEQLVQADIRVLDDQLTDWNGAFSSLSTNVWTGLYKFEDPTNTFKIRWHGCYSEPSGSASYTQLIGRNDAYCLSIDTNYATEPQACNTKLPYICYIDTGQCWFWPLEDKQMEDASFTVEQRDTSDLSTCAQLCRNTTSGAGSGNDECWAFVLDSDGCKLYFSTERHYFLLNTDTTMTDLEDSVVYLKVCAAGETSTMAAVSNDNSARPSAENCSSGSGDPDDWLDLVCYCDCDEPPVILEPEDMVLTIDEKVEKIVEELKVNPTNTSAAHRKLNSAEDTRTSAQGLGALGIAMLSLVFGGLILMDLNVVISHALYFIQNGSFRPESSGGDNSNAQRN